MNTTGRSTRSSQRTGIAESLATLAQNPSSSSQPHQGTSQPAARVSPFPSDDRAIPAPEPDSPIPNENPEPEPNPEVAPGPDPDDSDPEREEDSADSDNDAPNLALSLKLLAKKISKIPQSKSSSIKPRSPDTFDGTDPNKLETFVFQVSMYIEALSHNFQDDKSRVTFALSYLKGTPLEWFQNELSQGLMTGGKFPSWFTSYPEFLAELLRLFGPRDPINDATTAIEALRYKDSSKAPRYTLEFNRHARRTGWNDAALARLYYKSLPERLKDEIARLGKPTTLIELQELVATLDQRYWERQSEISRDRKPASSSNHHKSDNRSDHRSDHRTDTRPNNSQPGASKSSPQQQHSRPKDQKKPFSSNNAASSSSSSRPAGKPSIADILGPDGKLKPEERQRRMDNKLCLRCGGAGHVAHDCTVQSKSKPKGRAAKAEPTKAPADKLESGKG
jgi:hypothetical protein